LSARRSNPNLETAAVRVFVKLAFGVAGKVALGCVLASALPIQADADDAVDPIAGGMLPSDLSPWSMFLNADVVVQGVMIMLVVASALTWTIALAKGIELLFGARKLASQTRRAELCATFDDIGVLLEGQGGLEEAGVAARAEMAASLSLDRSGVKDRIASRFARLEARAARRFRRATGILATIGATSPFIGLFGTVWGVMNSFVGIAKHHTTNLAVIAPGLAEALLTTALGLAAAIPAVVFYNMLARGTASARGSYADGAEVILRLAARHIEASEMNDPPPLRAAAE
jgi:biopolymer transport protein ExbB